MPNSQTLTPERRLHCIFANLFDLSTQQMEALDNENFDKLADLLAKKDEVLTELHVLNAETDGISLILNQAASSGTEEGIGLRELVRRYQAHEKYIVRQVQLKLNAVGEKLRGIRVRKSAASGYYSGSKEISKFDMSS